MATTPKRTHRQTRTANGRGKGGFLGFSGVWPGSVAVRRAGASTASLSACDRSPFVIKLALRSRGNAS